MYAFGKFKKLQVYRVSLNLFSSLIANESKFLKPSINCFPSHSQLACMRPFGALSYNAKPFSDNVPRIKTLPQRVNVQCVNLLQMRYFSLTTCALSKKKKTKKTKTIQNLEDGEIEIEDNLLKDPDFDVMRSDSDILGFIGSQANYSFDMGVLVVQPWVKWGPRMKQKTTPQMMVDEAAALVATLPGIRVIHKEVVPLRSMESKTLFGSGTLERLVSLARSSIEITSVFISVDLLKKIQVETLQQAFGLRVMDRYSVVLGIFRHNACTKEAKLQVALAELPYIKKRLDLRGEKERMLMMEREKRLRNALNSIADNRALIRTNRLKMDIPTVAVVGYTNAGKTSLIRALTGDVRAEGENRLFATLDVTAHGTRLPCGLEALFIDTVGFIQEIPTDLIASFKATLEDAIRADVVVHVRDANHPDYDLQGMIVEETLSSLPIPDKTPVISVANKIDLGTTKSGEEFSETSVVSSVTGQGLQDLMADIETKILEVTGRQCWRFTLPTGSDEIRWLRNATGLLSQEIDPDNPQKTAVVAVMTDQELAAYRRYFRRKG